MSSDGNRSGWEHLANELKNPWDWTAAIIGGAGGAVATVISHGLDLGHSIPAGALAAVGARRAAVASLRGHDLKKKAAALEDLLKQERNCDDLVHQLRIARKKWIEKIESAEKFEKKIEELSDQHSKRVAALFPPPPPAPYPPSP